MWNKSIKIPDKTEVVRDEDGFPIEDVTFIEHIHASFTDVTRDDEILANQKDYTADQNIEIKACNYNGCSYLVDEENGDVYDIRRTFKKNKSMDIVLTCERRSSNGNVHG